MRSRIERQRLRRTAWFSSSSSGPRCLLFAFLLASLSACGPQGAEPNREEIIFEPAERQLLVLNSGELQFNVRTADGREAEASFYVDGEFIRRGVRFTYRAPTRGEYNVQVNAVIDLPRFYAAATWSVRVRRLIFQPVQENFLLWPTELVRLKAIGALDQQVEGSFMVNGSAPVIGNEFDFRQSEEGIYRVEGSFDVGGSALQNTWTITVTRPHPDPPGLEVPVAPLTRVTPVVHLFDGVVPPLHYVVNGDPWTSPQPPSFFADEPFEARISATVEGYLLEPATVYWRLLTREPTPGVRAIDVRGGPALGSLQVSWDRPESEPGQAPVAAYRIAWAEQPFSVGEFQSAHHVRIADAPDRIQQEALLTGLVPGETYYVRLQSQDADGNGSFPSYPLDPARASREISFAGWVRGVGFDSPPEDLAGMHFIAEESSTTTDADGRFALSTMSGGDMLPVLLLDPRGTWAGLRMDLSGASHLIETVLFPRATVPILSSDPQAPSSMSMSEYVRVMTANDRAPHRLLTWANWPVRIGLPDYVFESEVEQVDYRRSFERAIQTWNEALGEPLLVGVELGQPHELEPWIEIVPGEEQTLGQTVVLEPTGELFEVIPKRMAMRLRVNFRTQRFSDQVVLHEMGHVLGLAHSFSEADVMHSVVNERNPPLPSVWESFVARWLKAVPQGFDASWFSDGNN